MKKEDFRVMESIALLVVLAVPCCLLFCYDSMFLMFLGAFYTWEYWSNVLRANMEEIPRHDGGAR